MKSRLLCILHRSPPAHGAAKVGDFVAASKKLNEHYNCRFITIKSSDTIGDIGKMNIKKIYYVIELYIKVLVALIIFRPQKIYFTSSIKSVAFYRDLFVSTLWKIYRLFKNTDVYYHYHTKGINNFVSASGLNLKLTRFFIKDVNLVLLGEALSEDFHQVKSYKSIVYLPNGVENTLQDADFSEIIENKYKNTEQLNILYLSNMIKSKGYFHVLELATKARQHHYHFAGGWQDPEDEKEFFSYIDQHKLADHVTFHGFVSGEEKKKLFSDAHLFVFPTRYENEAFPLSILESLSYGVAVIATDEASIPNILDDQCGVVMSDVADLSIALDKAKTQLLDKATATYCRHRFIDEFSSDKFENNLVTLFARG